MVMVENKTVKNTALVSVGIGLSFLRFCAALVPKSIFAVIMAALDPVIAIAAGFAIGILYADGYYKTAVASTFLSALPAVYVAVTSDVGAAVFMLIPAAVALCLGAAVRRGTDRSTVVGITALVCAAMLTATAILSVISLTKTADITVSDLWNECVSQLNGIMRSFAETEDFAILADNYGITAEEFLKASESMTDGIFKVTLLLMPSFAYALYYYIAFFISFALKPLVEFVKKPPVEEYITRKLGDNEVHIHVVHAQPGYDSEFSVSSATKWAYIISLAVLAFGALFGVGLTVTVCAAEFAIALTPPFVILGYKFAYFLLKPKLRGAAVPVIVLVSVVLSAYSLSVPTAVIFGVVSTKFKGRLERKS